MNGETQKHIVALESTLALTWEGLLQSAPLSVFLLGQLTVISARHDFELHKPEKYNLIHHERFRPTLVQVSNYGYDAFMGAHRSMNQIRLHMSSIPRNVKTCLRILNSDFSAKQTERHIKGPIARIQHAASESALIAEKTYNGFVEVQKLLNQVAEVLVSTQGINDEHLKRAKDEIKMTEMEREMQIEQKQFIDGQLAKLETEVKTAQAAYVNAMDEIPTGWKAVFMDMVRSIDVGAIINGIFGVGANKGKNTAEQDKPGTSQTNENVNDFRLISIAGSIQRNLAGLLDTLENNFNGTEDNVKTLKLGFGEMIRQVAPKTDSKYFSTVDKLLTQGSAQVNEIMGELDSPKNLKNIKAELNNNKQSPDCCCCGSFYIRSAFHKI